MKFGFLFDLIDKALRISEKDRNADMRLPARVSIFGIAMSLIGLLIVIISIISSVPILLLFALMALLVAAFAFLYYKFQRIHVLSDEEFEYTNFLGKKKIFRFEDIYSIEMNPDSHILVMKKGRIFIESSAIMSERLKLLFNKELERVYKSNNERKHRKKR